MPRSGKVRRVYDNDDAWIMAETDPPLTPDIMWSDMIEPHEGSPVDGWLYSIGGHDVYDYETGIGERTSQAYGRSRRPAPAQSREQPSAPDRPTWRPHVHHDRAVPPSRHGLPPVGSDE